jgi:hypothetical protein
MKMSYLARPRMLLVVLLAVVCAGTCVAVLGAQPARSAEADAAALGLERAHAHNDYEHERPLYDALDSGFKSVEADVWLQDGELRVAHESALTQPGRTLESLYLKPLRREVRENKGSVYAGDDDYFTLLIDIKSEAEPTYKALHEELAEYDEIFTKFGPKGVKDGAVTAIVSGNRPKAYMQGQRVRYAAYDGRLGDLGVDTNQTFTPLISNNWTQTFTWYGVGPMPETEREKLRNIVATAHSNGQRVRFWATPEVPEAREAVWRELVAAEVDYINTDSLVALETFLVANDPEPNEPYVYWKGGKGGAR